MLTATLAVPQGIGPQPTLPEYRTTFNALTLAQFVDPLPIPEMAQPIARRPSPMDAQQKLPYYRVAMRQIESKMHRDLKPTRQWVYGSSSPGPTIETRSGE